LEEEYGRFGIKGVQAHPKIIEKELKEYEEADYISVPSSFVKRTFLEQGVQEEKMIQIPFGVDVEEFRQIPKKDNIFRVVYVGGMRLRKGVHYLLQAFSELNLPNSELLLVGSVMDEIKPFFKKYEGNYNWIGHRPQRELYKYYSQGSVFVMPSIEEGMAVVQLQAMACGLPLVCTTNTGGEDLIENGKEGFVIPVRNVKALKEKIMFFYENPKRRKEMGLKAQKRVRENFTWDDYGRRIINKYENIFRKGQKNI